MRNAHFFACAPALLPPPARPPPRSVRRVWLPNVHPAALWSDILQRKIAIKVTAAALRAVDRAGGVDRYLLHTSDERLASTTGVRLRRLLLDTRKRDAARARAGEAAAGAGAGVTPGLADGPEASQAAGPAAGRLAVAPPPPQPPLR